MNYHQQEITLPATWKGDEVTIIAQIAEDTGLCYHAVGGREENGLFVITHLASKKVLGNPVGTEYEVKLILESVVSVTDWHQSEHEIAKHPKIAAEFRNLQQDIEGQINQRLESVMKVCMPEYLVENVMNAFEENDECFRSALLYAFKIVS